MSPQQTHVSQAPAGPQPCARILWAEGGWRCLVDHRSVRLYSGGKRLLAHPVQSFTEGEQIAELWLRSIRRIDDLATSQSAHR